MQEIQGGSLSTILSQALTSEDKDQLNWILQQRDLSVIDKTLVQLKDPKTISALLKEILQRMQSQGDVSSETLWLK